ncbi:MAG: SDR family oxidoreductase [Spirochaetia bacterium]|jgi:NAD(P)-dependent dehydrogenase (short-subunit alcohol dehydrogenase family)
MSYTEEMFGLTGKTIAITGAGGVIAGAMAEALLKAGANVSLWAHRKQSAEATAARLTASCGAQSASGSTAGRLLALEADAADRPSVRVALDATEHRFGTVDILINCAGGNKGKSAFLEMDVAQFEEVLRLNLTAGLVVPTQVVAARWIERKSRGCIINLASMSSFIPLSGVWAYDAAKAAVRNLTMATAKEFAPYGIRVNALAPGFFIGNQNRALLIDQATGELTERGRKIIAHTPFGRFGEVSELAGALLFLASDAASGFVTGVTLPVDGGYLVDNV